MIPQKQSRIGTDTIRGCGILQIKPDPVPQFVSQKSGLADLTRTEQENNREWVDVRP